jgi:hypothetical protein
MRPELPPKQEAGCKPVARRRQEVDEAWQVTSTSSPLSSNRRSSSASLRSWSARPPTRNCSVASATAELERGRRARAYEYRCRCLEPEAALRECARDRPAQSHASHRPCEETTEPKGHRVSSAYPGCKVAAESQNRLGCRAVSAAHGIVVSTRPLASSAANFTAFADGSVDQ